MKMNKKITLSIISTILFFLIAMLILIFFVKTEVQAAAFSTDIDGINESKYPGYKEKLKQLKTIYPNIKVFYTGLDWNTVIKNEKVHSRNLVPKNYEEEWICEECGKKLYDTGWYCASKEAVEYLMDPRVYLDTKNIFQFQRLDTSAGTLSTSAIKTAAQGTFLEENDNVVAIYNAAKDNNINAFHLITRTIQEQGRDGTSILSSGKEYIGTDGVTYKGLYNLFSIGATGSNSAEVKTNGLARALREGWTSRPLSIAGGGTFIKDKYLNRGQNTLYLQKFDVDSTRDGLYWHQYMQNLFAAKNEAALMYEAYNKTKLTLNTNFEFIIPIYENMPVEISKEPNPEYYGNINTDLKTMEIGTEANGRSYITGEILIAEWINGVACVPKDLPEMTIKATDGSIINGVNLIHNGGLSYSYYRIIDNLKLDKEYYLEATLTTSKNLSTSKTQIVRLADNTVGKYKNTELKTKNNKIYFSTGGYVGAINTDLKEIKLSKNETGNYYLKGNLLIAEWIDGIANVPKTLPKLTLKSTDGISNIPMNITHLEGLNYNYDVCIDKIDRAKQYYIEAELTSEDNKGTNKSQRVILPEEELGTMEEKTIKAENNLIKPIYIGAVNTDLKKINLAQNEIGRNYITGEILIVEWIEGVAYEPSELPEMTIKATDGSYSTGMHVVHNGGVSYTYDRIIDNLDITKQYEIEVRLTGENNKSTNKIQIAKLQNKEIGTYGTVKLVAEDNKLKMTDPSLYVGAINTDLKTMYVNINEVGREYIHGDILVAEWIDGVACIPNGLPEMTLKSTDGTYSAEMHVTHLGGLDYYYDRVIFNLDTSKEYYIEVKLTGSKNIGTNKVQIANLNVVNKIGTFKEKNIIINNNKIEFKGNEYIGTINTDLKTMYLDINEVGREYIHGNILIAEWINGVACVPDRLPEMTLKSTDGTYSAGMHVEHLGGLNYYYDRVIFNLDTSKDYYIEVKLTNPNNISSKKVQEANMQENEEVGIFKGSAKIVLRTNRMKFEEIKEMMLETQEKEEGIIEKPQKEKEEEIIEKPQEEKEEAGQKEEDKAETEKEQNGQEEKREEEKYPEEKIEQEEEKIQDNLNITEKNKLTES